MDREERARAFQTGKTAGASFKYIENQKEPQEAPQMSRLEKERIRQASRKRQIRRRIALFAVLVLSLTVTAGAVKVLKAGKKPVGESSLPLHKPEESDQSSEESPAESESESEESTESAAGSAENEKTAYLRELQTRMPDYVQQDFIPVNEFSRPCLALGEIHNIVIHYVGNAGTTASANLGYFKQLANQTPGDKNATKASSNFIIGLDGEVIQCMPVYEMAYCSNSRNWDTLSIEVCHPTIDGKFNDVTYDSLIQFCAWLCNELDLTENDLIRHYDVTKKKCPLYYVDHPDAWEQLKADVGTALNELQKN